MPQAHQVLIRLINNLAVGLDLTSVGCDFKIYREHHNHKDLTLG